MFILHFFHFRYEKTLVCWHIVFLCMLFWIVYSRNVEILDWKWIAVQDFDWKLFANILLGFDGSAKWITWRKDHFFRVKIISLSLDFYSLASLLLQKFKFKHFHNFPSPQKSKHGETFQPRSKTPQFHA